MPREQLVVVKVPRKTEWTDHVKMFEPCEQMYLELLENKSKIKSSLKDEDYHPHGEEEFKYDEKKEERRFDVRLDVSPPIVSNEPRAESPIASPHDSPIVSPIASPPDSPVESPIASPPESPVASTSPPVSAHAAPLRFPMFKRPLPPRPASPKSPDSPTAEPDLRDSIKDFLKDDPVRKYSVSKNREYETFRKSRLPTLSELQKEGHLPKRHQAPIDLSNMVIEDEDLKREFLFKFDLLRKKYKNKSIPHVSIHKPLNELQNEYERTIRDLSISDNTDKYQRMLTMFFMVIEYMLGKYANLDMKDYTKSQIDNMASYERLLIELGEKSYVPEDKKWSVELRLFFLVMTNTAFFVMSKSMFGSLGNMIHTIQKEAEKKESPKRKMRGPTINLDDL
jgi:hypothetical protein